MSVSSSRDLVFHLLDIQSHDMRIESEEADTQEIAYESLSEEEDDEFQSKRRRRNKSSGFQQRQLVFHLFGATENGTPVRCDVTGFRPTIYIRLPEEKTSSAATAIKEYLTSQKIPMSELTIQRITRKIFYGFTANTPYPFLQIDVPSLGLFRTLRGLFLDENLNFQTRSSLSPPLRGQTVEVFEANIDPMLRFLHAQNLQPCGWVKVKDGMNSVMETDESNIVIECDYQQVLPTTGPRVSAPFLTASWDIECFSMTGDFPMPKRNWSKPAKDLIKILKKEEMQWI